MIKGFSVTQVLASFGVTIDSSNRVLIGSTTSFLSIAKLQVQNAIALETNGTGGRLAFFSYGNDRGGITTPATSGSLQINATTSLILSGGGNVGLTVDSNRNTICSDGATATNASNGFLYVPGCAGTPTGTPAAYTGRVPIVVDTTNNKLYFYSGGAWRDAGP